MADCCVDVPPVTVCATSDLEDDVLPDWEDDVPPVTVCATSAPGLEMADCCVDVPPVPVCATSDWEDDVPHAGPTGDTVSENEIIYVGCWSYEVGRKLGEGGFGSVYAGTRLKDGLKVALKFADTVGIEWIDIEDNPEPVPLEIGLLILANKGPRVPEIIQLLDWDEEPNRYIMVLEFPTPCESLIEYLDRHDYYIEENVAKVIMHQAAVAAQTCCQRGVLHRDIKLENLLINPDTLDVKLIDFGCGEILTDAGYTSFAGTEEYCPPEYNLFGLYHGKPATVWSLGVLMFTLVCGEFPTSDDLDMLNYNIWTRDGVSQECCQLLCSLLQRHPSKRLKLDVVCLHKWFKYFIYRFYEERSEDLLQNDLPPDWGDDVPPVPVCATSDWGDD
ncbi:serine/threonine-protein kinase pim-2-like [Pimephales promelas]|uniref:serine/threonine-protein kinase pim-2-like n=1 Tax=Pimephales promelas TaxID=90988 RepID=UPI0019559B56|nr:serine/threonine-protein kinase pim-2-like [Pimephales promelas]XP_039525688.1 serine/threonine-protein kinase pim-2-like [Pimephales promelas]